MLMSTDKTPLVNKLILFVLRADFGLPDRSGGPTKFQTVNQPENTSDFARQTEEASARLRTEPVSYLPVTNHAIATKPKLGSKHSASPNRTSDRSAPETPIAGTDHGEPIR